MSHVSVLLLTLPIHEPPYGLQRGNHQLFADFFRNYLRLRGEERFAVRALPRTVVDCGTNAAIVQAILDDGPDAVGFSLYLWNVERSIDCANRLGALDPSLVRIGGGPEVQHDNGYLLCRGAFDFLVKGEGERSFHALLGFFEPLLGRMRPGRAGGTRIPGRAFPLGNTGRGRSDENPLAALLEGQQERLLALPSLFVREELLVPSRLKSPGPRYLFSGVPSAPLALDEVQSGIAGALDGGSEDDFAYLEVARGCPFSCAFCSYAKNRKEISRLPVPAVLDQVTRLLERNVGEIYMLAPALNYDHSFFRELLGGISRLRKKLPGNRTAFFSELKAELLTDEDVGLMLEAGFVEFELGIQTLKGATAQKAGTHAGREETLRFIERIITGGGKPIVDFIVGLPGDRYEDCVRTIEALDRRGLLPYCVFYHLLSLPGSALRESAVGRGCRFSAFPPYQVLATQEMDLDDIQTVFLYLEQGKNHSYYTEPVYTDPSAVFTVRRPEDGDALMGSPSVKTGSVLAPAKAGKIEDLAAVLSGYADRVPEAFHHAYITLGGAGGWDRTGVLESLEGVYKALVRSFRESRNYFDRYCLSLDYLGEESFSKKATFLLDPAAPGSEKMRNFFDERAIDYACAVDLRTIAVKSGAEVRGIVRSLRALWDEKGVHSVILSESGPPGDDRIEKVIRETGRQEQDGDDPFCYWIPVTGRESEGRP
jgi:radical SAM superfamily enzyme YgiQ (UPF0313 family)